MRAGSFLDDRHGAAHRAERLEIAQQDHGIRKIRYVDRRFHVADQSVLGDRHECRRALAVEILQQFVHVQDQRILLRHRRLIAVEAVDHHGLDLIFVDPLADPVREFAGRKLGGIDLLDEEIAAALHCFEIDAKAFHAIKQQTQLFVENEKGRLLAARNRGGDERRWRAEICRCPPVRGSACSIRFRCRRPAAGPIRRCRSTAYVRCSSTAIFRRHQPREHVQRRRCDGDVMVAAAKFYAAIFDDAHTPPLRAIIRRQFLEPQHAMRDAVDGLVARRQTSDRRAAAPWRRTLQNSA